MPDKHNPAMEALEARAYRTIVLLAGNVDDGSDETVRVKQDDATREWSVRAGGRSWHGRSLLTALASAFDELRTFPAPTGAEQPDLFHDRYAGRDHG